MWLNRLQGDGAVVAALEESFDLILRDPMETAKRLLADAVVEPQYPF